ncbi:hypothetical protein MMC16_003901 [Acarospora aff. strigata]|nr:hypothetical protein [Acarospora aff. strigata]
MASNLLGNETIKGMKDQSYGAFKSPRRPQPFHRRAVSSLPPTHWGPSVAGDGQIGVGTQEGRQALVKAKKRETLLAANGHAFPDSNGRFKRRVSDEQVSVSAPPAEHEDRDALVYIHHVKPDDTLAGIMIKFNCQPAVFRKANGLWPNDSIQVRKTVVLPVEACGVKGRKIPGPAEQDDRLSGDVVDPASSDWSNADDPWGNPTAPTSPPPRRTSTATSQSTSPSLLDEHHEDPPWKHDSWVLIENHPAAVEIARLPRRTLGFFPRSRRKSASYSDLDTPPASLDLPRSLQSPRPSPRRNRNRKSRSSSGSYFASHLHGPGGVGTLERGGSPGPAQDGLNKLFAAHLPNVAPRASFESTTSTSSTTGGGIENVGGAIEGWVRKLATRAATIIEPQLPGMGLGKVIGTKGGAGDFIELSDAFEIGEEEGDGGGDTTAVTTQHMPGVGVGVGSARGDHSQERMLRERFPPRGRRVVDELPAAARQKKGD